MGYQQGGLVAAEASLEGNPGVSFLEGLLAAIAVSALSAGRLDIGGASAVAGTVVLSWQFRPVRTVSQWVFGAIGAVASVPAAAAYLSVDGCVDSTPMWTRILILIGLAGAFGWGFLHTLAIGRRFGEVAAIGLGWFAMIELLTFASTAVGVSVQGLGTPFVIIGVLVLGYLVGLRPTLAMLVAGVGMALVTLAGSALLGTPAGAGTECLGLHDATGAAFIYLVAFVPATFLWVIVVKPFVRGRS